MPHFAIVIFPVLSIASISAHYGQEIGSVCVGNNNLSCTKHTLSCGRGNQIEIASAFYGFSYSSVTPSCPYNQDDEDNMTRSKKKDEDLNGQYHLIWLNVKDFEKPRLEHPSNQTTTDSAVKFEKGVPSAAPQADSVGLEKGVPFTFVS